MFREEVAQHYRDKGYRLRENVQVRGASGTVHACDMVAQGPLGNLIIAFGDDGGLEGPELHAVRRAARDVGATPVVAAPQVTDSLRQVAVRANVVVLDRKAMTTPQVVLPPDPSEPEYPPWPGGDETPAWPDGRRPRGAPTRAEPAVPRDIDEVVEESLRPGPTVTRKVDPGIWQFPRAPHTSTDPPTGHEGPAHAVQAAAEAARFGWLPRGAPTAAEPTAEVLRAPPVEARREALMALRVVGLVLLAGAAAGAAFWALQSFF